MGSLLRGARGGADPAILSSGGELEGERAVCRAWDVKKRASRVAHPASALCGGHEPRDTRKMRYLPDQVETVREDGACVGWAIAVALLHLGVAGLSGRLRAAGIGRVPWRGSDD